MKKSYLALSVRERQIMDILYREGEATAADIQAAMPDPPSYSAVRATLHILEEKGQVKHELDGPRYLYRPAAGREKAKRTAVRHLVSTFFDSSAELAVATLLEDSSSRLSREEIDRLADVLEKARKNGGRK